MKQPILLGAGLAALMLATYGCGDTTSVPQERINAERKFRESRGSAPSANPTTPPATTTGQ